MKSLDSVYLPSSNPHNTLLSDNRYSPFHIKFLVSYSSDLLKGYGYAWSYGLIYSLIEAWIPGTQNWVL